MVPEYVTNFSNTVSVINTLTNTVIATIPVGNMPFGVAITPNGRHAYVANKIINTVSVIDTANNIVTATIPVGAFSLVAGPLNVTITPEGTRAYLTATRDGKQLSYR